MWNLKHKSIWLRCILCNSVTAQLTISNNLLLCTWKTKHYVSSYITNPNVRLLFRFSLLKCHLFCCIYIFLIQMGFLIECVTWSLELLPLFKDVLWKKKWCIPYISLSLSIQLYSIILNSNESNYELKNLIKFQIMSKITDTQKTKSRSQGHRCLTDSHCKYILRRFPKYLLNLLKVQQVL